MTKKNLIKLLETCDDDYNILIVELLSVKRDNSCASDVLTINTITTPIKESRITVNHCNRTVVIDGGM